MYLVVVEYVLSASCVIRVACDVLCGPLLRLDFDSKFQFVAP